MTRTPSSWKGRMERKDRLQSCGPRTILYPVMAPILNLRFFCYRIWWMPSRTRFVTRITYWIRRVTQLWYTDFERSPPRWEQRWTSREAHQNGRNGTRRTFPGKWTFCFSAPGTVGSCVLWWSLLHWASCSCHKQGQGHGQLLGANL